MIKSWQEFILESLIGADKYKRPSRGDIIEGSEDQIEEILQKWAPWYDPINTKTPLFRAVMVGSVRKPYYAYKVMDPKKFVRKPPTTENYYNIIIDSSENWVDYPKRSRSIMTHTIETKTLLYGNRVYRVIPLKEDARCAYIDNDYWMAFSTLFKNWPFGKIESLNDFNQSLKNVFNLPRKDYTKDKLKQLLSSSNLNKETYGETLSHWIKYDHPNGKTLLNWKKKLIEIEKNGSFYDWIDSQMIPTSTDVKLFNYNNDTELPRVKDGYEVWTDERCLLVDNDILRKLYIKKKNPVD